MKNWADRADLAHAYVTGAYAYGHAAMVSIMRPSSGSAETYRSGCSQSDNREHDLSTAMIIIN
jgi:hypothetical protein